YTLGLACCAGSIDDCSCIIFVNCCLARLYLSHCGLIRMHKYLTPVIGPGIVDKAKDFMQTWDLTLNLFQLSKGTTIMNKAILYRCLIKNINYILCGCIRIQRHQNGS